MNTRSLVLTKRLLWAAFAGGALYLGTNSPAQVAPVEEKNLTEKNKPVILSPFAVRTDKDQGYTATASLAGSRLNTELQDVAAAISVQTKEFLQDIGVTDVNHALAYGLNTISEVDPTGNSTVENNFNTRIRGITGSQRARNFIRTTVDSDMYNVDRLDYARGPNAILFGEGSPAGIINTTTKQAMIGRSFTELQTSYGSFDAKRATLDLNQSITGNFALRANLLWHDADGYREFEFTKKKAAAIAGIWQPFKKTEVKLEFERGKFEENRARPWTAVDSFSAWNAAGRPASGSPTTWGNAVLGSQTIGAGSLMYMTDGAFAGQVVYGAGPSQFRASTGPGNIPGMSTAENVADYNLFPRNGNVAGAGARSVSDYADGSFSIQQQIGDDLFIEIASGFENEKRPYINPIGFSSLAVRYDVNAYLPVYTGGVQTAIQPNPNFGKMITTGQNLEVFLETFRVQNRIEASYKLDFAKLMPQNSKLAGILGYHQLAVMFQHEEFENDYREALEYNVSPNRVSYDQLDDANAVIRVSYIDPFSPNVARRGAADPNAYPIANKAISNSPSNSFQAGYVNDDWEWQKTKLNTRIFAMQDYFFNGRLVTTFGWRHDDFKAYVSDMVFADDGSVTGFVRQTDPAADLPGETYTRGGVLHVLPWASLYYNSSNNFASQTVSPYFGQIGETGLIGNRKGKGTDAGVKFAFLDGKIHAQLGWYHTEDANQAFFVLGAYSRLSRAMWTALGSSNRPDGMDTQAVESEGYEFDMTANITKHLRLSVNAKQADTITSALLPNVIAYVNANRATWAAHPDAPVDAARFSTGTADTVGKVLTLLDATLANDKAQEGRAPYQDRKITGNIFGTYQFDEGLMKGFRVGGGLQYLGKSLIAYHTLTDHAPVYTPGYTQATAMLSYSRKLSAKTSLRVQLNIDNLFDYQKAQPVRGNEIVGPTLHTLYDGVAYTTWLPVPRTYTLSASFMF